MKLALMRFISFYSLYFLRVARLLRLSLWFDYVFEDCEMFLDASVCALLFHGRDVVGLEVDNTAIEAGLVYLVEVLGGGVEVVGFLCRDGLH